MSDDKPYGYAFIGVSGRAIALVMNSFSSVTPQIKNQDNSEVLVNVIVKQGSDGRTIAIVPGLPELQVEASDR